MRYRKVGTGFKDRDLDRLAGLLGALAADEPPFHTGPAWPCGKRTGGGHLRRMDRRSPRGMTKTPRAVVRET